MAEVLRTLVGSGWCAEWTRRCGPPFRNLPGPMWGAAAYEEVMALLVERGLGEIREQRLTQEQLLRVFVKGAFTALSQEAKEALKDMDVPSWSFGPPRHAATTEPPRRRHAGAR